MTDWDKRFLLLARHIAQWSKDPSTKTGAVIVDPWKRIVATGYNGFPRTVVDSPERYHDREVKYEMILHCEVNALMFARQSVVGCTLYTWPFMSCSRCAAQVIQAGITCHIAPRSNHPRFGEKAQQLSREMFDEARVVLHFMEIPDEKT